MDVKEVVSLAKKHVLEIFIDENVRNLGLEEIDFDETKKVWYVTVGFSRPWDETRNALTAIAGPAAPHRSYKVVRISEASGTVLSVKDRVNTP